ncbi:site-specific integrase [Cryobacterium algoricola]|uniref:Site-specific integrase n=1 Tax=Cryobacterium algoricola TaxID=1259183 RepID=A0ABY2I947_9MICO|nr:site-specific integrase [Cryobacterium algoricola]TFB84466.1 site-specific integrase [Cryobacterium algoricola]
MGSIESYVTASGKRYRVLYRRPDHRQTQKRGFRTKKDAELYLSAVEIKKATGEYIDATASKATIATLGADWLASQTHLKPSSLHPVEIAWRRYVLPTWGLRQVGEIRHSDVQIWISRLVVGRSATTVLRIYGVLAAILDVAVKDRRIPSNPARGVTLPRKTKGQHAYLSHRQVALLAQNSRQQSTLILVLAYTGLRWGEVTALRIRDVDTVRRRIRVHENAVNVGGTIHVGTPKTHQARAVPYPGFLNPLFAELMQSSTGTARGRDELLFGNGRDHMRSPDTRRGWFVSAVRKSQAADAAFPSLTLHDLRHTAASLAISAGANVKAIQRMLGHASAAMTLDTYADLFDDDLDLVADALDDARTLSID